MFVIDNEIEQIKFSALFQESSKVVEIKWF